ncbi:hypothetical protein C8R45DRAFT_936414 [Mycena sanguinolenta]|nr:hypothetical protein C8R45DRAFT_936414 [Mycena sanguinolenta]
MLPRGRHPPLCPFPLCALCVSSRQAVTAARVVMTRSGLSHGRCVVGAGQYAGVKSVLKTEDGGRRSEDGDRRRSEREDREFRRRSNAEAKHVNYQLKYITDKSSLRKNPEGVRQRSSRTHQQVYGHKSEVRRTRPRTEMENPEIRDGDGRRWTEMDGVVHEHNSGKRAGDHHRPVTAHKALGGGLRISKALVKGKALAKGASKAFG